MSQVINIPGESEPYIFPDGMSDQDIQAAIDKDRGSVRGAPGGVAAGQEVYNPKDVALSTGTGLVRGVANVPGIFGDLGALSNKGLDWAANKITGGDYHSGKGPLPTSQDIRDKASELTGITLHEPETMMGKRAEEGGEMLTSAGVSKLLPKVMTPHPAPAPIKEATDVLKKEGVTELTPGQLTGNAGLKRREALVGGGKLEEITSKASEQLTRAYGRRAGIEADRLTPDVMGKQGEVLGNNFNKLTANTTLPLDKVLGSKLDRANWGYLRGKNKLPTLIKTVNDDLMAAIKGSKGSVYVRGEVYKELRKEVADEAFRLRYDKPRQAALFAAYRDALDDAAERGIAQFNPELLGEWKANRTQYHNWLTLVDMLKGPGSDAALGIITPQAARSALALSRGKRAYVTGRGDFNDLTHAANATMLPPSGGVGKGIGAFIGPVARAMSSGAGAGLHIGGPLGAVAGALTGLVAPLAGARLGLSRLGRMYTANQALSDTGARNTAFSAWLGSLPYTGDDSTDNGGVGP